ncbi:MAG TPA: hypothetical protein VHB98_12350, partial [Chloroflexota bacterium]|nr:hypothetical protein [Chloroflexota bacterium]
RPSFTTYVGRPADRFGRLPHAIGHDWQLVYWPHRRAAAHGHEAVIGRLLNGQPIGDLGV